MHTAPGLPVHGSIDGGSIRIDAFGRQWFLDHPENLEDLWDAMDDKDFVDERIPYWVEIWPSSLVLAELLYQRQNEIRGEYCLDLGCGLGFTALIGQFLGAHVLACDYSPPALASARRNAFLNRMGKNGPQWLAMDWRAPAFQKSCAKRIWAGDILYEKRSFAPVLNFLDYAIVPGGAVWIGEPGRSVFAGFKNMAEEKGWRLETVFRGEPQSLHPGGPAAHVVICQMERRA